MRKSIVFIAVIILLTGCGQSTKPVSDRDRLLAIDREFSEMSVDRGMAFAFDAFMADSATILRNGAHPFTGRESIGQLYAKSPQGAMLKREPYFADVSVSGDMGYTLGKYIYSAPDSTGVPQYGYGHYVTIWKRQADGNWKYVFDTGNQSPPPDK